jgi:hypothetical protein
VRGRIIMGDGSSANKAARAGTFAWLLSRRARNCLGTATQCACVLLLLFHALDLAAANLFHLLRHCLLASDLQIQPNDKAHAVTIPPGSASGAHDLTHVATKRSSKCHAHAVEQSQWAAHIHEPCLAPARRDGGEKSALPDIETSATGSSVHVVHHMWRQHTTHARHEQSPVLNLPSVSMA